MYNRMRFNHRQAGVVIAAVALVLAGTALAQGPGGRAGCGMEPMACGVGPGGGAGMTCAQPCAGPRGKGRLTERLDLSDEQQEAITAIREKHHQASLELRKDIMRLRHELEGEWLKDEPAQDRALELVAEIGELKTTMQVNRTKMRLAIREQLTPQQRDKMMLMRQAQRKGGGPQGQPRSGRWHGRGHGKHGSGFGCGTRLGHVMGQERGFGPGYGCGAGR